MKPEMLVYYRTDDEDTSDPLNPLRGKEGGQGLFSRLFKRGGANEKQGPKGKEWVEAIQQTYDIYTKTQDYVAHLYGMDDYEASLIYNPTPATKITPELEEALGTRVRLDVLRLQDSIERYFGQKYFGEALELESAPEDFLSDEEHDRLSAMGDSNIDPGEDGKPIKMFYLPRERRMVFAPYEMELYDEGDFANIPYLNYAVDVPLKMWVEEELAGYVARPPEDTLAFLGGRRTEATGQTLLRCLPFKFQQVLDRDIGRPPYEIGNEFERQWVKRRRNSNRY